MAEITLSQPFLIWSKVTMSDSFFELKCFLHYKEGTSDKVYGILKSKDTIFCFYGKTNPPITGKDKGTLSIKYYDYMETDRDWLQQMNAKLNKGYEKIYSAEINKNTIFPNIKEYGSLDDVKNIYFNLEGSIKSKLIKAVLKFS